MKYVPATNVWIEKQLVALNMLVIAGCKQIQ